MSPTSFAARLRGSALRTAAVLPLLLAGCGDERFDSELASDLYAAPVRAVPARTVDAGPLPDTAAAVRVDEAQRVFSVGAPDGDERYLFGEIADVALSRGGDTVYVLDRMERHVKAFSREGRYLFRFGRRGKGPGEYEDPISLVTLPWNGGLAVWDLNLQRLTLLHADGTTAETVTPMRQTEMARQGKRLRAFAGGFVMELNDDALVVAPEDQRGRLVRLDTLGQVRDTLFDFAIPPIRGSHEQANGELLLAYWLYAPYWTPRPHWEVLTSGEIAFAPGGRPDLLRFSSLGQVSARITRPWAPEAITHAERVLNIRETQERGGYGKGVPVYLLEAINRKNFARVRPAVMGLVVASEGEVGLRRFSVEEQWEGKGRTWDWLSADGQSLKTERYPEGFEPRIVTADRVFGLRRDTLDVDYLEAYRR